MADPLSQNHSRLILCVSQDKINKRVFWGIGVGIFLSKGNVLVTLRDSDAREGCHWCEMRSHLRCLMEPSQSERDIFDSGWLFL